MEQTAKGQKNKKLTTNILEMQEKEKQQSPKGVSIAAVIWNTQAHCQELQ